MRPILPAILLACIAVAPGVAFQTTTTPPVPQAATPDEAPLPVRKGRGGAASELEGVDPNEGGVMSMAKYEGGSFSLKPNKITSYVNEKEVVLVQGKQRFAIPSKAITEVSYGNAVTTRVGQATGSAVLSAGAKNQSSGNLTVVGIVWTAANAKNGVVLRLDKGDFPNFLSALQNVTNLQAINTDPKSH